MIPASHILILALLQFTIGLLGLMLRRAGMVVLVSGLIMLNAVLLLVGGASRPDPATGGVQGDPVAGVMVLVVIVAVALCGAAVLYAFYRFRRTVSVDEHDRMKH